MITIGMVDAALDACTDDDNIEIGNVGTVLADLLDKHGEWDWSDGAEHVPSDRAAVIESSSAWWGVYRGTEADQAHRFRSRHQADAWPDRLSEAARS